MAGGAGSGAGVQKVFTGVDTQNVFMLPLARASEILWWESSDSGVTVLWEEDRKAIVKKFVGDGQKIMAKIIGDSDDIKIHKGLCSG